MIVGFTGATLLIEYSPFTISTRLSTEEVARSSTVTLQAVPAPEAVIVLELTYATKSPGPGSKDTAGKSACSFPEIIIASA